MLKILIISYYEMVILVDENMKKLMENTVSKLTFLTLTIVFFKQLFLVLFVMLVIKMVRKSLEKDLKILNLI